MLCVVDVGNTHTVIGLYDGESLEENWRLRTDKGRTSDEWGLTFKTLLSLKGREIETISAVVISSVAPSARYRLST